MQVFLLDDTVSTIGVVNEFAIAPFTDLSSTNVAEPEEVKV